MCECECVCVLCMCVCVCEGLTLPWFCRLFLDRINYAGEYEGVGLKRGGGGGSRGEGGGEGDIKPLVQCMVLLHYAVPCVHIVYKA